MEEGEDNAMA